MSDKNQQTGIRWRQFISIPALILILAAILGLDMQSMSSGAETSSRISGSNQSRGDWDMGKAPLKFSRNKRRHSLSDHMAMMAVKATGPNRPSARKISSVQQNDARYAVLHIEFDNAASRERMKVPNIHFISKFDRFADVFIPLGPDIDKIAEKLGKIKGIVRIEFGPAIIAPPPPKGKPPAQRGRQEPEAIVRGGISGLTGKGVIIAVIDSGIDFRNPDFITYDAEGRPTSRLLYLWDAVSDDYDAKGLGSKSPLSYPNGASIGTLYTRDQLTADLRSGNPRIPATDISGHGTACAGVAAGNGNNGKDTDYVKGVAPDADLIAIRIGGIKEANGSVGDGLDYSFLLGALVGWLDTIAADKPLVVSCSFSGQMGSHDGESVFERQLDARFPFDKKGRSLVIAAGNEGQNPIHAYAEFKDSREPGLISWTASNDVIIEVYFDTGDINNILSFPAIRTSSAGSGKSIALEPVGSELNPFTRQGAIILRAPPGDGAFFLISKTGKTVKADAYIYGGYFDIGNDATRMIGNPGTASNAITVGSYDWNELFNYQGQMISIPSIFCGSKEPMIIGGLSCYSNPGYSRKNGIIKPDIIAPGEIYHASHAKLLDGKGVGINDDSIMVDSTGNYILFNGTSAATPYVAGVVALLMEKKSNLTLGQIKELLKQHATSNQHTGKTPNTDWGHGKLDLSAIERIINAVN